MHTHVRFVRLIVLVVLVIYLTFAGKAQASSEQVIYSFTGHGDGAFPLSGVIFDGSGNLYGSTEGGGDNKCQCGVVFELTPTSNGWTQTVLHTFTGLDGAYPIGNLAMDKAGNLYGTTQVGGKHNAGVIFELMPAGSGWQEKVLHSFTGGYDGSYPFSGVILDGSGNVYCTARFGGHYSGGVALELIPTTNGWTHNVLHSFGRQGKGPLGGLIFDSAGNLYGTTTGGGDQRGSGVVYKLTPTAQGPWAETVLYEFNGSRRGGKDGREPVAAMVFDQEGNLYGSTLTGGTHHRRGTIFKLTPSSNGLWKETILHYGGHAGGYVYWDSMMFDADGNLWGTAGSGGGLFDGVVFRLTPTVTGFWKEQVIHSFGGPDGAGPRGNLVRDASGKLYGTTAGGGANSAGAVFVLTP
jgi:uncharacterized repeat protein (TIGR03803 family)